MRSSTALDVGRWLRALLPRGERRSNIPGFGSLLFHWLGMDGGFGENPQPHRALTFSGVWRAVSLISSAIASLPFNTYRRGPDDSRELAKDDPLYVRLHDVPNPEMTAYMFKETLVLNLLLMGNAYAEIEFSNRGDVLALWPLPPSQVTPERMPSGEIVYRVTNSRGERTTVPARRMLHVANLSPNGIVGYTPIALASSTLEATQAGNKLAEKFYNNGAMPSGVITVPRKLDDQQEKELRRSFQARNAGPDNAGLVMILSGDMKFTPITMPLADAQFIESRKFQIEEIARWFNLAAYWLSDEKRQFSNLEMQQLELVTYTLRPHLVRIEQEFNRKLFANPDGSPSDSFCEHNVDALVRADIKTRYSTYETGLLSGFLSVNEVRRRENLSAIPGGDEFRAPQQQPAVASSSQQLPNEQDDTAPQTA